MIRSLKLRSGPPPGPGGQVDLARAYRLCDEITRDHIPAIASLSRDSRLAVGAAAMLYRGILGKIVENEFDVFHNRAHLTFSEKVQRMPSIHLAVRGMQPVI